MQLNNKSQPIIRGFSPQNRIKTINNILAFTFLIPTICCSINLNTFQVKPYFLDPRLLISGNRTISQCSRNFCYFRFGTIRHRNQLAVFQYFPLNYKQFTILLRMDFSSAITIEGYLQKQSPNVIRIFQKRYFTFRNQGQFLVWFKKKPASIEDEPKGFIRVIDIIAVNADQYEDDLIQIKYPERTFSLKAENKSSRDRWVASMQVIRAHFKRITKEQIELKHQGSGRAWKWGEGNNNEVKLIRLDNQKVILNEGDDSLQQSSKKFQSQVMGWQIEMDMQKYAAFGYLNRKGFITTSTRWFFLCSEFNLYDERDDDPADISIFIQTIQNNLNRALNPLKKKRQDSSDSQNQQSDPKERLEFNKNCLYQFDIQTRKVVQNLPLVQMVGWSESINTPPYSLTIKYLQFSIGEQKKDQEHLNFTQKEKQMVLYSNYQTEIMKWVLVFKICFKRYSLANEQQQLLEERYVRYQIVAFRKNKDQELRKIGSETHPAYAYLNKDQFKVAAQNFPLELITGSLKKQPIKIEEDDEKEEVACVIEMMKKQQITIVFTNNQDEKLFRKRAKKFFKKIEPRLKQKKQKQVKKQVQEVNLSSYYLDKKIRESSSAIRINFYQKIEEENPIKTRIKPKKQQASFFDRFLSMFCSAPVDEEPLY